MNVPVRDWGYADERLEGGYGGDSFEGQYGFGTEFGYEYGTGDVVRNDKVSASYPLVASPRGNKTAPRVRVYEIPRPRPVTPVERHMENLSLKPAIRNTQTAVEQTITVIFRPARGTTTKDKASKERNAGIHEYTITQNTRMGTIMDDYCHAMKLRPSETKFILRRPEQVPPRHYLKSHKNKRPKIVRTRLREADTPLDLRLEDGDEIVVCPRENGEGNGLVLQVVLILIGAVATTYSRK